MDRIIQGLSERAAELASQPGETRLRDALPSGPALQMIPLVLQRADELGIIATDRLLRRDSRGADTLALALSYAFWAQAMDGCQRAALGVGNRAPFRGGDVAMFLWCLAVARAPADVSLVWGHRLHGLATERGLADDILDDPVAAFMETLLDAFCGTRPLSAEKVHPGPDAFGPLLRAIGTPSWEAELANYCDYRLSRAYEFPSREAPRAKPGSYYFFNRQWFAIVPLELLALKAVHDRHAEAPLSLDVDHPLLRTPCVNLPSVERLISDEVLDAVIRRYETEFGTGWQPFVVLAPNRKHVGGLLRRLFGWLH
ncbi:hypothetical protein [Piscinibacter gummiphilus]|uniref:Uncharacterized protein n=1 Tax=Piscinibacter gummiphilus TaxID=946333 RepID=A0ABZ0CPQ8_9BURK|nr:hypothetical protein [Piscinibacter gummiphilus]WOB06970.1 hypothetical protein RXV79_18835 [Piscinibacter gummiphilus]